MLDLDLDLEADLGVDTVKQAEMFAAMRETYNIPRDENLQAARLPHPCATSSALSTRTVRTCSRRRLRRPQRPPRPRPHPAVAAPAAAAPAADDPIKAAVLAIVAEKTGYPRTCWTWISISKPTSASIPSNRPRCSPPCALPYNIPRDDDLKLRDFPTLAHVIQFARDRQPAAAPAEPVAVAAAAKEVQQEPAPVAAAARPLARHLRSGQPRSATRPRAVPAACRWPLCKPTGVTLGAGRRVVVMPDHGGVGHALVEGLQSIGVEALVLDPAMDADALTARLQQWLAAGPIAGVYWLPALDRESALSEMDLDAWHEALRVRVKSFYVTMRALYEQMASPGHLPDFGDAARRPARLRRCRSGRAAGRRRHRLHQDLQARAHRRSRQSRRFRSRAPELRDSPKS